MAEWHATPSLQTVIPIWNHLSVIQDLGLRIVICIGLPIVSVNLIFGSIMLPKCWMGGMRLYTPLMKLLKKVKRTSFLNLQSFKSFNNAREFVMHLGKKKMPLLSPRRSKVNVIWFIWRSNIELSIAPHNDYPYFSLFNFTNFVLSFDQCAVSFFHSFNNRNRNPICPKIRLSGSCSLY